MERLGVRYCARRRFGCSTSDGEVEAGGESRGRALMGPDRALPESARDATFLKDAEGFFNFRPGDFIDRTPIGKGKCGPERSWLLPTDEEIAPGRTCEAVGRPQQSLLKLL